ncbi:response regulator [Catalinimonas niigatensis]|uniref:response regulator n=1 Tax=Catalinimonas niigatensis TaxID=1397264 RepID=UPI002665DDF3|nr:response regulator [Catalinimonas niigatensis]WPP50303.1 response regulator [Catalinimonas niigatensis]
MKKLSSILLVDDDETTNFVNQMLLEDMAVAQQVLVANNGKEALDLIRLQSDDVYLPELILLDINMPVMDGFEFLEAYEALALKHSVAIFVLTTSTNPGDIARLKETSINGFLNKPLTEEKVLHLLKQHGF